MLMQIIGDNVIDGLMAYLEREDDYVFLDTSMPGKDDNSSYLFVSPSEKLIFTQGNVSDFLKIIQDRLDEGLYVAGWFSYEFGYLLEPEFNGQYKTDSSLPLAELGVYDKVHVFDHTTGKSDFPFSSERACDSYSVSSLESSMTRKEYLAAIGKVLEYIAAGDTYQVNYTFRLNFDFTGSFPGFYKAMRRNQSVRYGASIRSGDTRIMSFSPELFFRRGKDHLIAKPMKGTVKRGRTLLEDDALSSFLKNDVKNQSENVMIVDLLRNDLGRLMHQVDDGKVTVTSLFDIECYESLFQMTSTVMAKGGGKEDITKLTLEQLFNALYPCGSITGAPKIRTMEIIRELETSSRGVYTGSIGYLSPDGEAVFNVPIRTVVFNGRKGEMGIGSGIVHDSDPYQEWDECLLKGRFLTHPHKPFQLIETLLWRPEQGFFLLDKHVSRLRASAQFFLFSFSEPLFLEKLESLVSSFEESSCHKVRILLCKDGDLHCRSSIVTAPQLLQLPEKPGEEGSPLATIRISQKAVVSSSCWCFHKTTQRQMYTEEYQAADADNCFDVVFFNEQGHLTEGAITNIILFKDGVYSTPPCSDGLLPGVMRDYLIEQKAPEVVKKSLTMTDLQQADAIYCCNSVRGVVPVKLRETGEGL